MPSPCLGEDRVRKRNKSWPCRDLFQLRLQHSVRGACTSYISSCFLELSGSIAIVSQLQIVEDMPPQPLLQYALLQQLSPTIPAPCQIGHPRTSFSFTEGQQTDDRGLHSRTFSSEPQVQSLISSGKEALVLGLGLVPRRPDPSL